MKMLRRLTKWIISHLFAGTEPDLTPFSYPTTHTPNSHHVDSPDAYLAGPPTRPQPMEKLAGFPGPRGVEAMHCWHPPSPYKLPVND